MAKRTIRADLEVSILIELDDKDGVDFNISVEDFLSEMDYKFVSNKEDTDSKIIETEIRGWSFQEVD